MKGFFMKYTKIIVIVLILLLKTKAGAIGTIDTTQIVHFLSTDPVPTFDPGAYVKGAIYFDNGFSLTSTATLPFGSLGTVNGTIALNNGTLKLTRDLYLGSNVTLLGPGFIDPANHSIFFSDHATIQGAIFINSSATSTNKPVYFKGNNNTLSIRNGRFITITPHLFYIEKMTMSGIRNYAVNTSNFSPYVLYATNSTFIFEGSPGETINLSSSTDSGGINFFGECKLCGNGQKTSCQFISGGTPIATLIIDDLILMINSSLVAGNNGGYITLNNSKLEFFNLIEVPYEIGITPLIINGICSLKSQQPINIYNCDIIINPASTLIIDNNTTIIDTP